MTVIVTGGAGFIGSHVVDALIARGQDVIVIDDLSSGRRENLAQHPDIDLRVADVADEWPLNDESIEGIVHLAAQVSVVRSMQAPLDDLRANAQGTVRALEVARQRSVPKVVFASSAATYGDVEHVPTPEDAPKAPLSPYGVNKLAGENWLGMYGAVHGVGTSALRFFNVYGPRQDPSSPYSGVISIFLERSARGDGLTIYGDGQQTRDFVYVGDVVRAILAALDHPGSTPPINVGTGRSVTIETLAHEVLAANKADVKVTLAEARTGDIRHSCAVVDRLADLLGVRAETSLAEGLEATGRWYRAQGEV